MVPKLTKEHFIQFNSDKMNVGLKAAQGLWGKGLRTLVYYNIFESNYLETAQFCETVYDMFDTVNSSIPIPVILVQNRPLHLAY